MECLNLELISNEYRCALNGKVILLPSMSCGKGICAYMREKTENAIMEVLKDKHEPTCIFHLTNKYEYEVLFLILIKNDFIPKETEDIDVWMKNSDEKFYDDLYFRINKVNKTIEYNPSVKYSQILNESILEIGNGTIIKKANLKF